MFVTKSIRKTALAVVLATLVGWCSFIYLRSNVSNNCVVAQLLPSTSCEPARIIAQDWYCLIDPICASPFYHADLNNMAPKWQGSATYLADPSLGAHDGYRSFGLINFALFATAVAGLALILKTSRNRHLLRVSVGLFMWTLLEWVRWSYSIWSLTQNYSGLNIFVQPVTYLGLILTALPLLVVGWWARSPSKGC